MDSPTSRNLYRGGIVIGNPKVSSSDFSARIANRELVALHLLVYLMIVAPFLLVRYPLLVDFPNHLARAAYLVRYDSSPFLQETFLRNFRPLPNLAIDLVVPLLARLMSVRNAGIVFLLIIAAIHQLGTVLVSRELIGERSLREAFLAMLFVNSSLLYGFVNYSAALAIFLVSFGLWIRWRNSWSWWRVVSLTLLAVIGFISHLSYVAFLGAGIAGVTAWSAWKREYPSSVQLKSLFPLGIVVSMFFAFRPAGSAPSSWVFNSAVGKCIALLAPFRTYWLSIDIAILICVVVIGTGLMRWSRASTTHTLVIWLSVLFFGAFIVLPRDLFTASAADTRLIPPAFLFTALALPRVMRKEYRQKILGLSLLALTLHQGSILAKWSMSQGAVEGGLSLLNQLPNGSHLYVLVNRSGTTDEAKSAAWFEHIPLWKAQEMDMLASNFFASPNQQPLILRRQYSSTTTVDSDSALTLKWQFLWSYNIQASQIESLENLDAHIVGRYDKVALWTLPNLSTSDIVGRVENK